MTEEKPPAKPAPPLPKPSSEEKPGVVFVTKGDRRGAMLPRRQMPRKQ
jgi:hypothetical protein